MEEPCGYLWPCKTCDGQAYFYQGPSITFIEPMSNVGSIIHYIGKPPKLEKCPECDGLGWWEPNKWASPQAHNGSWLAPIPLVR